MRATGLPSDLQVVVALDGPGDLAVLVRALDAVQVPLRDLAVAEPTLNDVYLSLHRNPAVGQ
jgi:ABC-2 type transport system ATP-binding protein